MASFSSLLCSLRVTPGANEARLAIGLLFLVGLLLQGQSVYAQQQYDDGTVLTGDVTLSGEVKLNGVVFVGEATNEAVPDERTTTLTIAPGTVIKGVPSTPQRNPGTLIVRRSARLVAEGTQADPIIFTSTEDDLSDPLDMFAGGTPRRGRWGGLIILGRATTNQLTANNQVEGTPANRPARYGGTDDLDDAGVVRYVSIRHGGHKISGTFGDEINGLTLGAVGRGTTIEYVEVVANLDDGFQFFGGTVHTKYLVSALNGDDAFDYDQGFRGSGQFWYALKASDTTGYVGEHDGGSNAGDAADPMSRPVMSNVTYFGAGSASETAAGASVLFRDAGGGAYYNSIFHDAPGFGVLIEDGDGVDSRQRYEEDDLIFKNNVFGSFAMGNGLDAITKFVDTNVNITGNVPGFETSNTMMDPGVTIDRAVDGTGGTDPRPTVLMPPRLPVTTFSARAARQIDGVGAGGYLAVFEEVNHVGAFDPDAPLWTNGWSYLDALGEMPGSRPSSSR